MRKTMLYFGLLLLVFGCSVDTETEITEQPFNGIEDQAPLRLVLITDKSVYKVGEPIIATLKLQNISPRPINVKKRMALGAVGAPVEFRDVYFLIDATFSTRVTPPELSDSDFGYLSPGDSLESSWDIALIYSISDIGMYYVAAIYQNSHDPENGIPSWRGELRSNTISFEVVGP
jgi:hypothetical protein